MLCFWAAEEEKIVLSPLKEKNDFCKMDNFFLPDSHSVKLTNKLRTIRLVFLSVRLLSGAEMARLVAPATSPSGYLSAPPTPSAANNPAALV